MVLYRIIGWFYIESCYVSCRTIKPKRSSGLVKTGWGYRFYLRIVLYANLYSVSSIGLSQGFSDGAPSRALSCQPVFAVLCSVLPCRVTTCVRCLFVYSTAENPCGISPCLFPVNRMRVAGCHYKSI